MLMLLVACSSECNDPSRIEGIYDVFSSVNAYEAVEGTAEEMPAEAAFYNGSREWTFTYVPSSESFTVLIDSQTFKAVYTPDEGNCNRFTLQAVPDWAGVIEDPFGGEPTTSTHSVEWAADMIWSGEELGGSYTVTDTWSISGGASGVLNASGTISGILVEGE